MTTQFKEITVSRELYDAIQVVANVEASPHY